MRIQSPTLFRFVLFIVATCCALPLHAGTRCGLVDGVTDGSTDADTDRDGIPDCLDDLPLVGLSPTTEGDPCVLVVDTFNDGDDGECETDCTLREALALAQGEICTITLAEGTYAVDLGNLVIVNGVSIVGAGADVTTIDTAVSGPAMLLQYAPNSPGGTALLTGLTLEYDHGGFRTEDANPTLRLTNCILQGPGTGISALGEITNNGIHSVFLDNTIIRDGGTAISANGGSSVNATACLITQNSRAASLGWGFEYPGKATFKDCEISFNGGAFFVDGAISGPAVGTGGYLRLERCLVQGNHAVGDGGAIYLESGNYITGGNALVIDSIFENNHADGSGGAIYIEGGEFPGDVTVRGSTFHDNTATHGGALYLEPSDSFFVRSELENSTLSGNEALVSGGAIHNEGGAVRLYSSTVAYNVAIDGGGIFTVVGPGSTKLGNTILGANQASGSGPDCGGELGWVHSGYNLIGDLTDCAYSPNPTDIVQTDPELTPLADNGGPTPTHLPEVTSQAVENGIPVEFCLETDQRGVSRPQHPLCDIGAVEVEGDLCPGDPNKTHPGICGCGVPDTDTDGDGVADCVDLCPLDPDMDGDGYGGGDCPVGSPPDCDDANATVYPGAPEVNDGLDNQCPGDHGYGVADETTGNSGFHNPDERDEYSWPAQLGAESYQVARTSSPGLPGVCIPTSNTFLVDLNQPGPGGVLFYLNRPVEPHLGSWGQDSARRERDVTCGLSP